MKVDLSTTINLPAEAVWAEVQTAPLLMHIAWPLMRFVAVGKEPRNAFKDGECYVKFKRTKFAKLNCQQLPVPSGFLGQPIVGNNISTLLVFGQPIHTRWEPPKALICAQRQGARVPRSLRPTNQPALDW